NTDFARAFPLFVNTMASPLFFDGERPRLRTVWRLLLFHIALFPALLAARIVLPLEPSHLNFAFSALFGVLLVLGIAAPKLDVRPFSDYGLQPVKRLGIEITLGFCVAVVAITGVAILLKTTGSAAFYWHDTVLIEDYHTLGKRIGYYFLAMMAVGFYEELWTRSYVLLNLAEGFSRDGVHRNYAWLAAAVVSSVFFAVL
ncbi:hypothetical protein RZS08_08595, partial [Arthrospira platensis SPKY1]|nr:hypothetical protein [Arthrospira platensis SPKY1]